MQYSEITVKQVKKVRSTEPAVVEECNKVLADCGGTDPVYPGRGRPSKALAIVRSYIEA